jgi:cell division topological specificity factor
MNVIEIFFGFGRKKDDGTALKAKERLKLVLAHERPNTHFPFMDDLREDIIKVIQKYMKVEDITIKTDRSKNLDIDLLEVEVSLGKDKEDQKKSEKTSF